MSFSRQRGDPVLDDRWGRWWNARTNAMKAILGQMDRAVYHAPIPLEINAGFSGSADVVSFSEMFDGIAYVTSGLIGNDNQRSSKFDNYELMICHRAPSEWGPRIISRLARYTLDAVLSPGETMSLGPTVPPGSTITAFLFLEFAAFRVLGRNSGLLLCIGITQDELDVSFDQGSSVIEHELKEHLVYPYTDWVRPSVL